MQCRVCLEIKDPILFTRKGRCKACQNEKQKIFQREHRKKPENKEKYYKYMIKTHMKRTYGLTIEDYNLMLEKQNGKCLICNGQEIHKAQGKRHNLSVDHCHATGKVRGLLCKSCNQALGLFKENIECLKKAISYLENNVKNSDSR